MWDAIRTMLGSKKAIAAIAGVVVVLAGRIGLDLPTESIAEIVGLIIAYVLGQGLADIGKEADRI